MGRQAKPKMAICYDFDGTLAAGNMQEYDYFPQLGIRPKDFWAEAKERARIQEGDEILAYMCLMLEKANADTVKGIQVTKAAFAGYAKKIPLFSGVDEWFGRINAFGKERNVTVEHFIISSGLREMIDGTSIARHFTKIYASSFHYDQHGVAHWPALALNYTTKTQFLFRINKGQLDVWDNSLINAFQAKDERPVPFERMVYIGDGETDVPCMRLVKDQGGFSISVYKSGAAKKKVAAEKLFADGRVNLIAPADYRAGKILDTQIKAIIDKVASDAVVRGLVEHCEKTVDRRALKPALTVRKVAEASLAPTVASEIIEISESNQ